MNATSTRGLLQQFCNVSLSNDKDIKQCWRLSENLFSQAENYLLLEDFQLAYVFYKRCLSILLIELPKRNNFNSEKNSNLKNRCIELSRYALSQLEQVSKLLDDLDFVKVTNEASFSVQKKEKETIHEGEELTAPSTLRNHDASKINRVSVTSERSLQNIFDTLDSHSETHKCDKISYPIISESDISYIHPRIKTPDSRSSVESKLTLRRPLVLPSSLISVFESIALTNTLKGLDGIETCGILAGRISNSNSLLMKSLIIPKQYGTSDSCTAYDEETVFEHMLHNKLINLGWIHTHPRQSCFMSSIDLHTHFGYQTFLPEAVAIVLAPSDRKKNVGIFRLKDPDGVNLIKNCTLSGFHPHPTDKDIYEDVDVTWDSSKVEVVDLR